MLLAVVRHHPGYTCSVVLCVFGMHMYSQPVHYYVSCVYYLHALLHYILKGN